jgi:hypothetical protein
MIKPSRKTRTSRAQQVVNHARKRNVDQGNVQALPSTRLEPGTANGNPTLTAIFPKKRGGGEPDCIDISFLLDYPGLTQLFAAGMLEWLKTMKHTSRCNATLYLSGYWFAYPAEQGLGELVPAQLDEQIMAGFKTWLHKRIKDNGKPLSPRTITLALGALRRALDAAPGAGQWVDLVPAGPRGTSRKSEPTEVLTFDQFVMVMSAAEKEVLALRARWDLGRRLLAQGRELLRSGVVLERSPQHRKKEVRAEPNLALTLAMLDHRYPGVIPNVAVIESDDPLLGDTVKNALGHKKLTPYFYPSPRDIVPIALCVAFATVFNPDTVLKLEWKNIDRNVDRLSNGRPAVQFDVTDEDEEGEVADAEEPESTLTKITGDKPRARRQLVRLLDPEASGPDQVSLNLVLDLLTEMTVRIRPQVIDPEQYGDRLFLFVQTATQKRAKGFGNPSLPASGDGTWQAALRNFIDSNALPAFTFKTIRATLIDYVQLFNRGDLEAARQVGNHASRVTTWTHYTSHLVRRLLQEATGETLLVRERWLQSDGKLDPRKFGEWTDRGCATPGWACLDPFDSPRANQKNGKLCNAYGECPACPLSAARPNHPRHVMLYEALRRAIYRSVTRVTAAVWQQRWAPVVADLDGLLARVPAHILAQSRTLSVELPDIG